MATEKSVFGIDSISIHTNADYIGTVNSIVPFVFEKIDYRGAWEFCKFDEPPRHFSIADGFYAIDRPGRAVKARVSCVVDDVQIVFSVEVDWRCRDRGEPLVTFASVLLHRPLSTRPLKPWEEPDTLDYERCYRDLVHEVLPRIADQQRRLRG